MTPNPISKETVLQKETFLFDADGVLWTGDKPVPGAIEFITSLLALNKKVCILTNNSTKTLDHYMKKIHRMGYGNVPRDNVISPAVVLGSYLAAREEFHGKQVYLVGTESLKTTLETEGKVKCFGTGPDSMTDYTSEDILHDMDLSAQPVAVVCSFDPHFSYPKLMKAANYLARKDVHFFVTNEDYTFPGPNPNVIIPGSGSTSAALRAVSGRDPIIFGKPDVEMAKFLQKRHNIDPATSIMFGDRLDTDIAFANNNNIDSCFVLTGVHTMEDVDKAKKAGNEHLIPKYTFSFV